MYIYVIGGSIGIAKSELHISYLMEADIYVIGCSIVIVDSELAVISDSEHCQQVFYETATRAHKQLYKFTTSLQLTVNTGSGSMMK